VSHRRFDVLDGMRGVAALVVVERHATGWFGGQQLSGGYLAVDFFFLLSGFVIAASYDQKLRDGSLTTVGFLLRRALRLYPLYLLALAAMLALMASWGGAIYFWPVVLALGFLPDPATGSWLIGPAWSLMFEAVANLAYGFGHRWAGNRALLCIVLVGLVLQVIGAWRFGNLDIGWRGATMWGGIGRVAFSFPLGVLLFRSRARLGIQIPWAAWPTLLAFVVALSLWSGATLRPWFDLALTVVAFPALLIVGAGTSPQSWSVALFSVLGAASYAIYVMHTPVVSLFNHHLPRLLGPWEAKSSLVGCAVLAFIFCAGLALDRHYDQPLRRVIGRVLQPKSDRAQNVEAEPQRKARSAHVA
jgi:peptidoglycan/LPS O-acetylase OafA/YrhL